jgi:hypothetical protein
MPTAVPNATTARGNARILLTGAMLMLALALATASRAQIVQPADATWLDDPAVLAVLEYRRAGIEAMTSGRISAETERYSTTFVANTPNNSVVPAAQLLELFSSGTFGYAHVEQHIEYAASHGAGIVVVMGEEIVVPDSRAANAGQRVRRRFTDVFRLENGEWRHDLRHANVIQSDE